MEDLLLLVLIAVVVVYTLLQLAIQRQRGHTAPAGPLAEDRFKEHSGAFANHEMEIERCGG